MTPRTTRKSRPRRGFLATAAASAAAVLIMSACSAGGTESGNASGAKTRTVTDIAGEVEVPAEPQRIVSVDFYSPATLVDLGIKPVGVVEGFEKS
ncbi:ABC transporter substrate-binding protein, partial [Streptomyces sp. NPDC055078]